MLRRCRRRSAVNNDSAVVQVALSFSLKSTSKHARGGRPRAHSHCHSDGRRPVPQESWRNSRIAATTFHLLDHRLLWNLWQVFFSCFASSYHSNVTCKWWLIIEYDRDFWIGWFPLSPSPVLWLSRGSLLFSERPLLIFSLFQWSEESKQDGTSVLGWQELTKYTIILETVHKTCNNMTFAAHMKSIYAGLELLDFYKNTALLLFPEALGDLIKRMFCWRSKRRTQSVFHNVFLISWTQRAIVSSHPAGISRRSPNAKTMRFHKLLSQKGLMFI